MRGQAARRTCGFVVGLALTASCGGASDLVSAGPPVDAADVQGCLTGALGAEGWSELPMSDAGTVYGVDFGSNSVLVYIEPDAAAVRQKMQSIREAEDEVGNTGPDDRVILRGRGNVLVSWPNEPTAEQRALVERCVGFS
jgi:hypothetical protein